jgi:glycosyltransferase involved in cell wall biosynthesis
MRAVPWLVADGYIANYQDVLNKLPLILVTSHWVKEMYERDGIDGSNIEVLPVGCDTDAFKPFDEGDEKIAATRELFGVSRDELMVLTIGGDATSKGAQEVMQALSLIDNKAPSWKYVCKVWPQRRTEIQNLIDRRLARKLGIKKKVIYNTSKTSRFFTSNLLGACDIYAAPSRLEGFGMPQVEAGACGKPVISLKAMGMLDTLLHGETGLLAKVAQKITVNEVTLGRESGFKSRHKVFFDSPRIVDYRADIEDIARYLTELMNNAELRKKMGRAGRKRVVESFDYRLVAKRFVEIIRKRFQIE